ncbi:hypothetical protein SEPCBS119000_004018 [Sporothrix epigloea]|uniref:HMA domain-containing protein n=1 Tax=Sporothrix epigloea TaxID=1892477 RepID=A0ABP0DPV1_9PEZI
MASFFGVFRPLGDATTITTSILIGNIHCPSCINTIREVLEEACADHIRWVSPNIVTSMVTVEHDAELSIRDMVVALANAGLEISGVSTSAAGCETVDLDPEELLRPPSADGCGESKVSSIDDSDCDHDKLDDEKTEVRQRGGGYKKDAIPLSTLPTESPSSSSTWAQIPLARWTNGPRDKGRRSIAALHRIAQAHLKNCERCRQLETSGTTNLPLLKPAVARQSNPTAVASKSLGVSSTREPAPVATQDSLVVAVEHEDAPGNRPLWKAVVAVEGMTCAACVTTITEGLRKKDWVTQVAVNLIANSATVEFTDAADESKVVDSIEELGYGATIDSVVRTNPPKPRAAIVGTGNRTEAAVGAPDISEPSERTVEIRIDGIYCEKCPNRVARSLAGFRRASLEILRDPTPQKPIIKLKYVPEAPVFTIRQILAAIEAGDSELKAAIYNPPTLEERSKLIQAKHRRQYLYRVLFTGLACVPTLVIGVIYMTAMPKTNAGRLYMMRPWTSGISRAQVALFVLATLVYFFAADIFHKRSLKEIRFLWRRSGQTPFFQRFYRFGSMNTLISLGSTIAYFSSVGQMVAAAARRASAVSDDNFYFDSVVFLTFFLLLGRLIESYSKSRTGDAVEMLGRLRPTEAILVDDDAIVGSDNIEDAESSETASPPMAKSASDRVVQANLLDFGDVVRVLHGASPPADGVLVQGRSNFDESSLTGESRLVPKAVGDALFSGTVNKDAPVLMRVTGISGTSMLEKIVAVVREGQTKRAPIELIAELLTTYFVPNVTLLAILTWLIWLGLGMSGAISSDLSASTSGGWPVFSLQFAIAVFVVACPCGLGLAAPTAIFVAGGMAAKHGILVKGGGEAFEKASRIDCVVFDKTGTLTLGGEPTVTDSVLFTDCEDGSETSNPIMLNSKKEILMAALKAVEENSSHPIARAIVKFCASNMHQNSFGSWASDLQEISGRGMRAAFRSVAQNGPSSDIIIGNEAMMADFAVVVPDHVRAHLQQWQSDAKSIALAATRPSLSGENQDGQSPWKLSAALAIADPIRPEAAAMIETLQARGVCVYMLSGDNAVTAAAVARQVGIPADQVIAQVLPTEKAAKVRYLQASLQARTSRWGRRVKRAATSGGEKASFSESRRALVAMVGDGINDSPALTQADIGIAIGSGSDVAISSADFVLIHSNLQSVVTLLELSKVVFRRIALNFAWALVYNLMAVPIAAGVLYPIHTASTSHVRLKPEWASLAMAMSSISVVCSSLMLRSRIPGLGFRPTVIEPAQSAR